MCPVEPISAVLRYKLNAYMRIARLANSLRQHPFSENQWVFAYVASTIKNFFLSSYPWRERRKKGDRLFNGRGYDPSDMEGRYGRFASRWGQVAQVSVRRHWGTSIEAPFANHAAALALPAEFCVYFS